MFGGRLEINVTLVTASGKSFRLAASFMAGPTKLNQDTDEELKRIKQALAQFRPSFTTVKVVGLGE